MTVTEQDLSDFAAGDVRPTAADGQEMARRLKALGERQIGVTEHGDKVYAVSIEERVWYARGWEEALFEAVKVADDECGRASCPAGTSMAEKILRRFQALLTQPPTELPGEDSKP